MKSKNLSAAFKNNVSRDSCADDVLEKIKTVKHTINEKLSQFVIRNTYHSALSDFVDETNKILLSPDAKRIRSIIPILIGETLSLDRENCVFNDVALELLHFTSLIHDDVIDGHHFRRGYPTLNNTFARNQAVLVGDYMMCEVINHSLNMKHSEKVIELLVDAVKKLVTGVIMEQNVLPNEPLFYNYDEMVAYKTGSLFSLSFGLPFVADSLFSTAKTCGNHFGFLFQVYDDYLDRETDKSYENIFHILSTNEITDLWNSRYDELILLSQKIGIETVVLDMVQYLQSCGYFLDFNDP